MMQTSVAGRAAIKQREGVERQAYKDSVGVWTIGVGHTSAAGPPKVVAGMILNDADVDVILTRDLEQFEAAASKAVRVVITQNQFDALVSLAFNIGAGAFTRSTLVKKLNAGDIVGAADAFLSWNKAGGKPVKGLTTRRKAEREQFLSDGAAPVAPAPPAPAPDVPIDAPRVTTVKPDGKAPGLFSVLASKLGFGAKHTGVPAIVGSVGDPTIFYVQKTLREKAYYTKGFLDGLDGGITQSAVAQARKDNGLGDGGIDAAFLSALPGMPQRPVSEARATLTVAQAADHAPELFSPPSWLWKAGLGAMGLGGADSAQQNGLLDGIKGGVDKANDIFGTVQTAAGAVASAVGFVVEHRTVFLIAAGAFLVWKGVSAILGAWIKVRQAFF